MPAHFRGHPFVLARTQGGQQVLCVDVGSGLIGAEGEAFFNADGSPSEALGGVVNFLTQLANNRTVSERICAVLAEHQLIQPWAIRLQVQGGEQALRGLFRIDETRLNALSPEALKALQLAGALPLAYLQLLSMQHLAWLGQLSKAHAQQAQAAVAALPTTTTGELDLEFLNQNGTISFGNW